MIKPCHYISVLLIALVVFGAKSGHSIECGFAPVTGENNVLVILVNFSDTTPVYSRSDFEALFFGNSSGTVNHYYRQNSYGGFGITGRVTDWVTVSQSHDYYTDGDYGQGRFNTYPNNAHKLVEEAVDLVESGTTVDFSQYDNNGDGCVDSLLIVHQGEGGETSKNTANIWSFMGAISAGGGLERTYDGVHIDRFAIVPELYKEGAILGLGPAAHEYGHMLGIKDHYDKDRSSNGLGVYDLMSSGVWGGDLESPGSPVHLSVYNKIVLGWISPVLISGSTEGTYNLGAVEDYAHALKIPANPEAPQEYYLVSNRQNKGYDSLIPSYGVAVYHVDERNRFENQDEVVGCGYHFPLTALEQADGAYDLENEVNPGDTTDLFPTPNGSAREFKHSTVPSSINHDCRLSGVSITNIGDPGDTVSVTVTANDTSPYSASPYMLVAKLDWQESIGDGDAYLEAGENFKALLTLLNNGATANTVTAELTSPYPYFSFGSTVLEYPAMGTGETASATNNVYVDINSGYHPGRPYALNITVTHDGSTTVLSPEVRAGKPKILYVDDDGGEFTERHLAYSMEEAGYFIETWSVEEQGAPAAADLSDFKRVLWITGPVKDTPLSSAEITSLTGFLDNGGELVLSSPYLLLNPTTEAENFAADYLYVDGHSDDRYAGTEIIGIGYDPLSHHPNYFSTTMKFFYYPVQNRSFALTPAAGARGCVLNGRGNYTGVCFPDEPPASYQSVFLSVGIENGLARVKYLLWRLMHSFNYKSGLPFLAHTPYSLRPKEAGTFKFWGFEFNNSVVFSFIEDDVRIVEQTYDYQYRVTMTLKAEIDAEPGWYDMVMETESGDTVHIDNILEVYGDPVDNIAPVADAGVDTSYNYPEQAYLDGSGSHDPDYDNLTYQWEQLSGQTVTLQPSDTCVSPYFETDSNGVMDYLFSLTVSDPYDQDGDTVRISIINAPPVADAGPDRQGNRSDSFVLDGESSHDPEGEIDSIVWQQLSGATVSLQPSHTVKSPTLNPAPDFVGDYLFEIVVSDPLTQASDTVRVVIQNIPPVSDAGPDKTGSAGVELTLDGSSSYDEEGDPLTYHWTQLRGETVSLDESDPARPVFVPPSSDNYAFSLSCEDPYDMSLDSDSVEVIVASAGNNVPVAEAGEGGTVDWANSAPVQLDGTSSYDPDGDTLTYEWTIISKPDESDAELSDPSSATPTFDDDVPGDYEISLRVYDGDVWSFLDHVTIISEDIYGSPDADNDLMPNQWELVHGLDPLDPSDGDPLAINGLTDPDGDGNSNVHEYVNGSDPQVIDAFTCTNGLGGCYFGDGNQNHLFDSADIGVIKSLLMELDVSTMPLYPEDGQNMDLDGDGYVTSGDYSIMRGRLLMLDNTILGAPYEMELISPGYSVTVDLGDTVRLDVRFYDNPEYADGLTTSRPGLAAQFEVIKGSAYIIGGEEPLPSTVTLEEASEVNTDAHESTFTLRNDGKEMFVSSDRSGGAGGFDIYRAERPDTASPFGAFGPVSAINTSENDISPALSGDGLTMYFLKYSSSTHYDIYYTTRPDLSSDFGAPQPLIELNTDVYDGAVSVTDDHLTMYVTKYSSTTGYDIYRSTRPDTASDFSQPQSVDEINTTDHEYLPTVNGDDTKIYFASDRPDEKNGMNIWYATRSSTAEPFSGFTSLSLLNTDEGDYKVWEDTSEKTLYFSTLGYEAGEDVDIYKATRTSADLPYWACRRPGRYEVTDGIRTENQSNAFVWLWPDQCGTVKVRAHLQDDFYRDLPALSLPQFITVHVNCP